MRFSKIINKLKKDKTFYKKMCSLRSLYVDKNTNQTIPENGLKSPETEQKHIENKKKYLWYISDAYDLIVELKNWDNLNLPDIIFDYFLFYDSIDKLEYESMSYRVIDMWSVLDNSGYKINYEKGDKESIEATPEITSELENITYNKMIGIFIDRDMSETELKDLIKKIYKTEIKPIQKSYGMKKDWARERPIKDSTKRIIKYIQTRSKELKKENIKNIPLTISKEMNKVDDFKKFRDDTKITFSEQYVRQLISRYNLK